MQIDMRSKEVAKEGYGARLMFSRKGISVSLGSSSRSGSRIAIIDLLQDLSVICDGKTADELYELRELMRVSVRAATKIRRIVAKGLSSHFSKDPIKLISLIVDVDKNARQAGIEQGKRQIRESLKDLLDIC